MPEHESEILGGPTGHGNAIRINVNGNRNTRNIMLKVSQWKQIIGLLSIAQRASEWACLSGFLGSSATWKWGGIEFSDSSKLSIAMVELWEYKIGGRKSIIVAGA